MNSTVICKKCKHNTNANFSHCENCGDNLNQQYSFVGSRDDKPSWSNLNKVKHHKNGKKQDAIPSMKKR